MKQIREQANVSTSARDPINRWLDVFVRLLRVPKADTQRIRDELEDHLRARVDDLMLTGHAEPEAVRIAVAELGETAELARQFQSATKPHRRLTMLAGSAIVSVGLITSAVFLTQLNAPPPMQAAAIASVDTAALLDRAAEPVFTSDLAARAGSEYATLGDAVNAIGSTLEKRVLPHERALVAQLAKWGEGGNGLDDEIKPIAWEGLTVGQGLLMLGQRLRFDETDPLVLHESGDIVELAPRSLFDRRDAVLREYTLTEYRVSADPYDVKGVLESTIEPQLWVKTRDKTPVASADVAGGTVFVTAPPRIHDQIEGLLTRMRTRAEAEQQEQAELRLKFERQVALPSDEQIARTEAAQQASAEAMRQEALEVAEELAVKQLEYRGVEAELFDAVDDDRATKRARSIRLIVLESEIQQLKAMLAGIHETATSERSAVARSVADRAAAKVRMSFREAEANAEGD